MRELNEAKYFDRQHGLTFPEEKVADHLYVTTPSKQWLTAFQNDQIEESERLWLTTLFCNRLIWNPVTQYLPDQANYSRLNGVAKSC